MYYDLRLADAYRRLIRDPTLIRQECDARGLRGDIQTHPIIIDEIQKIPELLDEVHWLIENRGLRFILCGSSARNLKRQHGNLLEVGRFVTSIARECGVSAPTIKQYFEILEDTLIGTLVPAYRKRLKRRVVTAPRFYFFDVGIVAQLTRRGVVEPGSSSHWTPHPWITEDGIEILPWRTFLDRLWGGDLI